MDTNRIRAAIQAHRRLKRIYRQPERAPEWSDVMADLVDAEAYFKEIRQLTADQALDYRRVRIALRR